jgi:hypothetical protein
MNHEGSERTTPTPPPHLVAKLLPLLSWFGPESLDVPQFMLDVLDDCAWWDRIEGETRRAYAQLKSVREIVSSRLELAQGALEVLGKGLFPHGRVSFLVFFHLRTVQALSLF